MKKILTIILLSIILLTGCGSEEINVNVENTENLYNNNFGRSNLMYIGNGLWYDSATRIVYWWNGSSGMSNFATTPTPYYAPNGLPYKYNPETNTFEEI